MSLDFSKIAGALNTFSESPSAKQRNKSNINLALLTQDLQEQKRARDLQGYQAMMQDQQDMLGVAKKLAIRSKDVPAIQDVIRGMGSEISNVIENEYGGDIDRFYRSIGPEFMTKIKMDAASKLEQYNQNYGEYVKYVKAQKDGLPIFQTVLDRDEAFYLGKTDNFVYGDKDMLKWEMPDSGYMNKHVGKDRADVILGYQQNYEVMSTNLAIERNLTNTEILNTTPQDVLEYSQHYFGAKGDYSTIQGETKPKEAKLVSQYIFDLGSISAKDVLSAHTEGSSYDKKLTGLKDLTFLSNEGLNENYAIHGYRAFEGFEAQIAEAFLGATGYSEAGVDVTQDENLSKISIKNLSNNDGGSVFDETGMAVEGVSELEDEFYTDGIILAYKTLDGKELLTKEEAGQVDKRVKPVYVASLRGSGNWFGFNRDVIYKELNFENPIKAHKLNQLIKFDDEQHQKNLKEQGEVLRENNAVVAYKDLNFASKPEKLNEFMSYYSKEADDAFRKLGSREPSLEMKSLILSLAKESSGDVESYLDSFSKQFAATSQPAAHKLIVANDTKGFLQLLKQLYMAQGASEEEIDKSLAYLAQNSEALYNASKK
jgi:hypothetical protein